MSKAMKPRRASGWPVNPAKRYSPAPLASVLPGESYSVTSWDAARLTLTAPPGGAGHGTGVPGGVAVGVGAGVSVAVGVGAGVSVTVGIGEVAVGVGVGVGSAEQAASATAAPSSAAHRR